MPGDSAEPEETPGGPAAVTGPEPGGPDPAGPVPAGPDADDPPVSDAELLRQHVAGDPDAFGELFGRHRDRLWAVAIRTLGDPEEAADALQDAMISAFRRAGSFRGDSAVTTWLHRIVVNACLDRLRRRAARPAATGTDEQVLEALAGPRGRGDPAADSDTSLDVRSALRTLPPDQQAALVLVDMLGLPGRGCSRGAGSVGRDDEEPLLTGPGPAAARAGAPAVPRSGFGATKGATEPNHVPARQTFAGGG